MIINIKGVNEKINCFKTSCGLKVYVWENSKARSTFASLVVKYGATTYRYKQNNKIIKDKTGIAHFLEHIMFNIDETKTATDIYRKLGTDENAYTDDFKTLYHINFDKRLKDNLNTLLDMVLIPYFNQSQVEKESGIITEEKRRRSSNPYQKFFEEFGKSLYNTSNHLETTLGTYEDIKNITAKDLEKVYNTFYHPENMIMIICGNVKTKEVEKIVKENLSKKKFSKFIPAEKYQPKEKLSVARTSKSITGNINNPRVMYGIKLDRNLFQKYNMTAVMYILNIILRMNFDATTEFNYELHTKNLIIDEYFYVRDDRFDNIIICYNVETNYPKEVSKIIKDKLMHLEIDYDSFIVKRNATIASYIGSFENNMDVAETLATEWIVRGDIMGDWLDVIRKIDYELVKEVFSLIDPTNITKITFLPNK